jgi:methylthioribose-1-phosphate isomerase
MPKIPHIVWIGDHDGHLQLLDQRLLPTRIEHLQLRDVKGVYEAIQTLAVRGAPAIGVAAAYGMVIAGQSLTDSATAVNELQRSADYLNSSRPTAVNLSWALNRCMMAVRSSRGKSLTELGSLLLREAQAIHREDAQMCDAIGRHGVRFIAPDAGVLTHCNAGYLATGGSGTALSILYEAQRLGIPFRAFADETRPLLQGARLTAWELSQEGIDVTLITDSMAGLVMRQGKISVAIVGADRIAANGDAANKIGTYSVAVLCKAHGIPLIVAAPSSTFDLSLPTGQGIPIEERNRDEITHGFGRQTAPDGVGVYNPAFDVTPAELIHAIVTERGVICPVTAENVKSMVGGSNGNRQHAH